MTKLYRINLFTITTTMLLSFALVPFAIAEIPGDINEGEKIKQDILTWLHSIKSLQCSFTYRLDTPSGAWKEQKVEYRRQGDMEYYQSVVQAFGGHDFEPVGSMLSESMINGKGTLLGHQSNKVMGEINLKSIRFPHSTRLVRKLLEQLPENKIPEIMPPHKGLNTILSIPGTAILINKEEQRLLVYWSESETLHGIAVNLYLDEENKITKIVYLIRPYFSMEEVLLWATKPFYEIGQTISIAEFSDYKQFNGIWFPCYMKEKYIGVTQESLDEAKRNINPPPSIFEGKKSYCERDVKRDEALEYEIDHYSLEECVIDPDSIKINREMSESDFLIEVPPETSMVDRYTDEVITTARETWLERHADMLIILAALGILGGVIIAGWRYWLGKP